MAKPASDYSDLVESHFPGLIDEIRNAIQESESRYEGKKSESFLWEHTTHTASLAWQLAQRENADPLIPVIAALFHDAGKFAGGRYHSDDATAEEEDSAKLAEAMLRRFGMRSADIRRVLSGLRSLYREKSKPNAVAAIIHDADFLSKFGALGVAVFFIKSALRRRTLRSTVLGYLSKELTYASCLPLNMRTAAGRKLAARKASDSIRFFRALLTELRDARIADLRIRQLRIAGTAAGRQSLAIQIVASPVCTRCGGVWSIAWTTEKGVKCHKLSVDWACQHCGERLETSFCLPEIAP